MSDALIFWCFAGIIVIQNIVILYITKIMQKERQELYSRLMAKDLADFVASTSQDKPKGRNAIKKNIERFVRDND